MNTTPTDAASTPIVTPCHQRPLRITTRFEGSGHLTTDVPDTIWCDEPGCFNTWTATGTPEQ